LTTGILAEIVLWATPNPMRVTSSVAWEDGNEYRQNISVPADLKFSNPLTHLSIWD